ncbi:MAG TPA: hypothetical protein IGS17_01295 [Oscillatoriales cyanobacterium M59_W2019_021]|nr:hypothetical protein [Oscillatoriales cyanobacterium M4454_W2019_049]HIK49549.1 hypothetical protein [Oscillatoriales cyanobacterium M59_W2019_021]
MTKDKGQRTNQRSLVCTIAALASGALGLGIGGFLSTSGQMQVCQTHPWGVEQLCSTWVAPGAFFRGGVTGLWVGTILGAFAAGVATHQPLSSDPEDEEDAIAWLEIQARIEAAARLQPQASRTLTAAQTRELLLQLGFSETTIDRAMLPPAEERGELS